MTLTQDKFRLISADDHVDLSHEQIKANLATKFHQDYDNAIGEFIQQMMPMLLNRDIDSDIAVVRWVDVERRARMAAVARSWRNPA